MKRCCIKYERVTLCCTCTTACDQKSLIHVKSYKSHGAVFRVGRPVTGMLEVRFPLSPLKNEWKGVSVHLLAMAEVTLSKAPYPHAPWALWMAAHCSSVWHPSLWGVWTCACAFSTGANLDGLKAEDKFCMYMIVLDNKSDLNLN